MNTPKSNESIIQQIIKNWLVDAALDEPVAYTRNWQDDVYELTIYTDRPYDMYGVNSNLFRKYTYMLKEFLGVQIVNIVEIDSMVYPTTIKINTPED